MIHLYGELGNKYGESHNIKVKSIGEAVRAMEANFPGFRKDIKKDGEYAVFRDEKNIGEEDLPIQKKNANWTIIPVPAGSGGNGVFQTVLGIALIVVGVVINAYTGGTAGNPFIKIGIAMALSGVAQMLTPMPNMDPAAYGDRERPEERPSYLFNGPTNKTQGGHAIPAVFGEIFIGSTVVSAGIRLEDIA